MDNLDKKIRAFLIEKGYLFPVTDAEIENSIRKLEANPLEVPKWLDKKILKMSKTTTKKK